MENSGIFDLESKELFLDYIDTKKYPPGWWEALFRKSNIFEEKYGKDLYNFTTPEIMEFYKFIDCSTLETLMVCNINLIHYGDWALMNNRSIDGQNHFTEIDMELLQSCLNQVGVQNSIITQDDLERIMRELNNALDKYIFYAVWEGIKGREYNEIINLKMSDINPRTNEATLCTGRTIKVSDRFIAIAAEADAQIIYNNYSDSHFIERPLIPSATIYKEKSNSRGIDKPRTVYMTLYRNIKNIGLSNYLTLNSLYQSGLIHYLNKAATANNITVEELLNNAVLRKEVVEKYNFNVNIKKRFLIKYKDFLV